MTKYTATDANGTTHTRGTTRAYTHCVVAKESHEDALTAARSGWAKTDAKNFAYYTELVYGTAVPSHCGTPFTAKWIADAASCIAGFSSAAEYCAAQQAERIARIEAKQAAGGYNTFRTLGFCGSHELARKLAATCNKHGGYDAASITILDAVEA